MELYLICLKKKKSHQAIVYCTMIPFLPTVQAGPDIAGKIAMHVKRLEVYLFLSGIRRSTSMCLPTTTTKQVQLGKSHRNTDESTVQGQIKLISSNTFWMNIISPKKFAQFWYKFLGLNRLWRPHGSLIRYEPLVLYSFIIRKLKIAIIFPPNPNELKKTRLITKCPLCNVQQSTTIVF